MEVGRELGPHSFLITLSFLSQVWLRIPSCTLLLNLIHHHLYIHWVRKQTIRTGIFISVFELKP